MWAWALFQQFGSRHQEARCAVSALDSAIVDEGLLYRVQFFAVCQAFNSHDFSAVRARGRHQAGHYGLAIQEDCTSATFALGAAFFGADQLAFFAQQAQQGFVVAAGESVFFTVDRGFNWTFRKRLC